MKFSVKSYLANWIFQPKGVETGSVVLKQRRVFIIPMRQGLVFGGTILLMLAGSINYSLSLGFVLTFMLASLSLVAILHTFRNLAHLKFSAGKVEPVFAGETATFSLYIENTSRFSRHSIGIASAKSETVFLDVAPQKTIIAKLAVPTSTRGILKLGRFNPFTRFPLGLFYA